MPDITKDSKMQFTPLKFQIPLAAGGIALMAFNYLQYVIPHGKGMVNILDVMSAVLTAEQLGLYWPLIVIMLVFTLINLGTLIVCLKQFIAWIANKGEYLKFMSGPPTLGVGIFVPVASLSMTACVIMAPVQFFIPYLSSNLQVLMLPGVIFFGILWFSIFRLEFGFLKTWFIQPIDLEKLSFVWLLDVFAFGLVSLVGTGIAVMSLSTNIASIAAVASLCTLIFGIFLLVAKLTCLFYIHIKAERMPTENILPA
ncbi:MAG: hypothetical protein P4L42_12465 [Desulfocapsaceae bacterium]|nr:hypothetical protein [Desulfocapsaceae bacterium]